MGDAPQTLAERDNHTLFVFGRLGPDQTPETVAPELEAIAARLEQAYPTENEDRTFGSAPLSRISVSTSPRTDAQFSALSVLVLAMSGVVLLIACLNLANMLLARGATRRREIAIRLSLGGGRGRVVRQLLAEAFVLAAVGGALGLVVAVWAVGYARDVDRADPADLDRGLRRGGRLASGDRHTRVLSARHDPVRAWSGMEAHPRRTS